MCTCKHGQDRHYLGYAGPGVCGGISGKCLEAGCKCEAFVFQAVTFFSNTIYYPASWTTLF
jgi:hypothetical protein